MNRMVRITLTVPALALGLALAGCESFDPTTVFEMDFFNTKKKLPGERRAVFPEGTPGVPQGVPQELVKGYQAPPEQTPEAKQAATQQAEPAETKPKPKPQPKPKVVAKPKEEATASADATRPQAQSQTQWPDPPPTRQQPAGGGWPGSAQPSGGVAWPDPPAPR
jgi:outer membrane biosynthesis protein TonB